MKTRIQLCLIALAFLLLAALVFWQARLHDTAAKGYLPREDADGTAYEKALILSTEEGSEEVVVSVAPRKRSAREIQTLLAEARDALDAQILHGLSAAYVDEDLSFVRRVDGSPVAVSYMTSAPDFISFDGLLGEAIPKEGAEVTIFCTLSLDGQTLAHELLVTVFPRRQSGEATRSAYILQRIEEENDLTAEALILPDEVDGQKVRWRSKEDHAALLVLFCGGLFILAFLYEKKDAKRKAAEKKKRALRRDYPDIASQLSLYLGAGLSLRGALHTIVDEDRQRRKLGGAAREGFLALEEICLCMRHGVLEEDAYLRLGEIADEPAYRRLSSLFAQELHYGSARLRERLLQEARDSFSDRKKEARMRGEEAGTKLLFPMLLLFADVLLILLVPAFWSLQ